MKPIRTERLILRQWRDDDRALFHRINSDDRVMEFFPFRRNRAESDALLDELTSDIESVGYGFAAVEIAATGECAGFAGITEADIAPVLPEETVEIGWRLAPEFWGKGIATEAALAWLDFGFTTAGLDQIVSIAVATNHRSTAVMERIGMTRDLAADFCHPAIPDDRPDLGDFVLYRLDRKIWLERNRAA